VVHKLHLITPSSRPDEDKLRFPAELANMAAGMGMIRRLVAIMAVAAVVVSCGRGSPAALVPIGAGLRGPAGLSATVYAHGLPNSSALVFDGQGRLWVSTADSVDHGHDGVYVVPGPGAAPVEVLAGVHTPLGLLWLGGSLYVASAGGVDAYGGFDGTRFASRRTVVTFPAGVGELNQLVLAPDGRIQLGISAPCDHCVPASKWSAAILSFRPDGSDLRVDATGIRAPIGLIYVPHTSDLLVTMNQRDDLGSRTPGDWLAVVQPGQAWRFPTCYGQPGAACAGVPRPTAVLDKHAAVSGVTVITGQLGKTVGTSALVAEWATGKVQRVALKKSGTRYSGSVTPFLTGVAHPVPVLLGPDGAVLVGDWGTGTVYRLAIS
jgi:glucose/arabinose dehydrogenase